MLKKYNLEKNIDPGKIKYDDKILHRSKVIKIFTEDQTDKDKINKDFIKYLKKLAKIKNIFFPLKM